MLYPVFTAAFTLSAYYSVKKFDRSSAEIGALHFEMGRTIVSQSFNTLDQVLAYYRGKHAPQFIELIFNIVINFDDRPEHYIHPRAPLVTLKNTFILGSTILTDLLLSKVINDWENLCKAVNLYGNYYLDQIKYKLGISDINAKDKDGNTALMVASAKCDFDKAKFLIDNGANIDARDKNGNTALNTAAMKGHYDIAELLIKNGADVEAKDYNGDTPLNFAAAYKRFEMVEFLIKNGADVNVKDLSGDTPFIRAFISRNSNMMKLLIKNGADVNAKDHFGNTPLMYSLKHDNIHLTKFLVENGAKIDLVPHDDLNKLLHSSIRIASIELTKFALNKGADINIKSEDGISLLSLVIRMEETNKIDLVKYLLKQCANPYDADSLGQSLLHIAAARTNLEVIDLLFKYGANPYSKDHAGNIPAQYTSNQEVAEFIAQKTEEYDTHIALHQPFATCEPLSAV